MADIDVKRSGPSIWPWVIGLLVLALLIWALTELFDSDDDMAEVVEAPVAVGVGTAPPGTPAEPLDAGMPAAVNAYLTQCTEEMGEPAGDMGRDHQFTVECLQQLRGGVNALLQGSPTPDANVSQRLDAYTQSVQQLQASEPTAATHANLTRDAAGTVVPLMQAMQTAWFGGDGEIQSALGEVQRAAEGIQGDVPMLEQRESVHTFFREAGDALRMMSMRQAAGA